MLEGTVVFGGDSNTAFDQGLDKSLPPGKHLTRPSKQSLHIAKLIFKHGLVDIWKEVNLTLRDFAHYSSPHWSFVRIDHIFIASASVLLTNRAYIKEVVWSNHSTVSQRPSLCWRLNKSILSDPIRAKEIENNIQNYFHTKLHPWNWSLMPLGGT